MNKTLRPAQANTATPAATGYAIIERMFFISTGRQPEETVG